MKQFEETRKITDDGGQDQDEGDDAADAGDAGDEAVGSITQHQAMRRILIALLVICASLSVVGQSTVYEYAWIQGTTARQVVIVSTAAPIVRIDLPKGDDGGFEDIVKGAMVKVQEYEAQGWELFDFQIRDAQTFGVWIMRKPKQ